MRRRASALLTIAVVVLQGHAAPSAINLQTPASHTDTITTLAQAAYDEWLGPARPPLETIDAAAVDARGSMALEAQVAFLFARARFANVDSKAFADGAAWYLQSRVVEQAFNQQHRRPGYRHYTACFFDCEVVLALPALTLSRWADGVGRPEFLRSRSSRAWPVLDRRGTAIDPGAFGVSLALASLERELGWPSLQGALRVIAQGPAGADVVATLEAATGRRLAAVFEAAANGQTDFLIRSVAESSTDGCAPPDCHRTEVAIAGPSRVPFPFTVRFDFADGSQATARWEGTADAIVFESASPFTRIQLDPDRHWLLDTDYANNEHFKSRTTNVPVGKWLARWLVWLQDATLTYTFFV